MKIEFDIIGKVAPKSRVPTYALMIRTWNNKSGVDEATHYFYLGNYGKAQEAVQKLKHLVESFESAIAPRLKEEVLNVSSQHPLP